MQKSNSSFPPFHNETGRWLSKSCWKSALHILRFVSTQVIKYWLCFKSPQITFGLLQPLGQIFYAPVLNVPKQKCHVMMLGWSHTVSFSSVQLWPLTQARDLPQKNFFDQEPSPTPFSLGSVWLASRPIEPAPWGPLCDCLCAECDSGYIPSFSSPFSQEICMGNAVLLSLF